MTTATRRLAATVAAGALIGAGIGASNALDSTPRTVTPAAVVARMAPADVAGFCQGYRDLASLGAPAELYRAEFIGTYDQKVSGGNLPTGASVYSVLVTRC